MAATLGRMKDTQVILQSLLAHVSTGKADLPAADRSLLAARLREAADQEVTGIRDRVEAIAFADRFVAAARCLPHLAARLFPVGPEVFDLRRVYDPGLHHEATPETVAGWRTDARRLVSLAGRIVDAVECHEPRS